jgi:hypothetical protein
MVKQLFILGTGFIGGSVLTALLEKKDQYSISALNRDDKKVAKLEELGVRPVKGSLDSDDVISKEAAKADVRSFPSFSSRRALLTAFLPLSHRSSSTSRLPTTSLPSRASSKVSRSVMRRRSRQSTSTPAGASFSLLPPVALFAFSASKLIFSPQSITFPQSTSSTTRTSLCHRPSLSFPFRTGVLTFPDHPDDILFNDKSPEKFDTLIPKEAPHREIDLFIKESVESKKLNAKISIVRCLPFRFHGERTDSRREQILPPTIYGIGTGSV